MFLLVAEELHFGRAAQRAFMTQPAFSQQIRALERRLGLTLVDRGTRTAGLTPAGQALVAEIRAVVEAADRLRQAADEQKRAVAGRVVIGSLEATTSIPPIPAIFDELQAAWPDLAIEVLRMGFGDWAEALLKGVVDAAFVFPPVPAGVQSHRLATMPRIVCMPDRDPLAGQGPLSLHQLSDRPVIGWSPRIPKAWRDFWSVDPRPDGTAVRFTAHETTEWEPALTAIAFGEGVMFPPEPSRWLYQRHGVAYAEVTDLTPCWTALVWRAEDRDKPVVAALRKAAQHVTARSN
ncbi:MULTISPECIES: LysR family transcriptional regulator [unclassified Streptomyces]|uniref:LysR substrate-binding domain-containing protein n=1 Tax=unclassified Streptomyces TaxID=2593676 RepID=UPI00336A1774